MTDWFVNVAGQTTGPHPGEYLVHWVRSGQVPVDAVFWPDGGAAWLAVDQAWPLLTGGPWSQPVPVPPAPLAPGGSGATVTAGTYGPPAPGAGGLSAVHALTDRLADFAGVEGLEGFQFRALMSAVFHRYPREEIERHFATGLPGFTPDLTGIESGWPKPWMFVRLLGGTTLLFLGFLFLTQVFQNPNLLPGLIVLGSFAVPLSVLVFFFELNTPRNVSLYLVVHCMMAGGLISLALTLVLGQATSWTGGFLNPVITGIVEETAKLLAVFLITMRLPAARYPWILNGMLFGAAIGAGFACFESAGYALRFLITAGGGVDLTGATRVIVQRGLLAPFGHVVWTALAAGALWRVKLDGRLRPRMLGHSRVLRMLGIVIALHALWDIARLDLPFFGKYLLLGLVAWFLTLGMLVSGLKQIKAAQLSARAGYAQISGNTTALRSVGEIGT
jgi:RsiW-degrading membrane proteinase PrsW (M82 family)